MRPYRMAVIIVSALVLIWVTLTQLVLPIVVKKTLISRVQQSCETCQLDIGEVGVGFFHLGSLSFTDVHLQQGVRGAADLEASVPRMEVVVNVFDLLSDNLHIDRFLVKKPDVMYTDGERPKPKAAESEGESAEESKWNIHVKDFAVEDGTFTYRRVLHKEASLLKLHSINLKFLPFGSSIERIEMRSQFQLEKSGSIELNVATPWKSNQLEADVLVLIKNQNMADLNVFFKTNDGVILQGIMLDGRGEVNVRGSKLDAQVKAVYKDFQAKLIKNEDQSAAVAFFTTLGLQARGKKDGTKRPKEDQVAKTSLKRKPNESLVHFILQGLKAAALKVATN